MIQDCLSWLVIVIGMTTCSISGLILAFRLGEREPRPPKWLWIYLLDSTGILIIISDLKKWRWKEDKFVTIIFLAGIGIVILGGMMF